MSYNCKHPTCDGDTCRREQSVKRKRTPIQRKKHISRYNCRPEAKSDEDKAYAEELKAFFENMMDINEPICANCGSFLPHLKAPWYKFLWKSCQAHLLPKRHFKSIATHPLNIMVLGSGISGLCHCHDIFDAAPSNWPKMPIWNELQDRFKIIYPLITPEEHKFIPDVLLNH